MSQAKIHDVEYREYYENGRRVKEYIVKIELNVPTKEDDPINIYFLDYLAALLYDSTAGGGVNNIGITLCKSTSPPDCVGTTPPNGKDLSPLSNFSGSVTRNIDTANNRIVVIATAVDSSTDSYNWDIIILKYTNPNVPWNPSVSKVFSRIAYVSQSGTKASADIIRVQFLLYLSASQTFAST